MLNIFSKGESKPERTELASSASTLNSSLKSTVSLAVLQEKTAAYVAGSINAKAYATILKAAFGNKVNDVLPEILGNLPDNKAKDLSKAI